MPPAARTQNDLLTRIAEVLGACTAGGARPARVITLATLGPVTVMIVRGPGQLAAGGGENVARYADKLMGLIRADRAGGAFPATVATLAGIHEHVDVNRYLRQAGISPAWAGRPVFITGTSDHESYGSPFLNALCAEVNRRLCLEAAAYFAGLADSAWA